MTGNDCGDRCARCRRLEKTLAALVLHDYAEAKREGLDPCLEAQFALQLLQEGGYPLPWLRSDSDRG